MVVAQPLAGPWRSRVGDARVRERFLYSYRLIYEARPEHIAVLAVLHGRRLLESIGERFEAESVTLVLDKRA